MLSAGAELADMIDRADTQVSNKKAMKSKLYELLGMCGLGMRDGSMGPSASTPPANANPTTTPQQSPPAAATRGTAASPTQHQPPQSQPTSRHDPEVAADRNWLRGGTAQRAGPQQQAAAQRGPQQQAAAQHNPETAQEDDGEYWAVDSAQIADACRACGLQQTSQQRVSELADALIKAGVELPHTAQDLPHWPTEVWAAALMAQAQGRSAAANKLQKQIMHKHGGIKPLGYLHKKLPHLIEAALRAHYPPASAPATAQPEDAAGPSGNGQNAQQTATEVEMTEAGEAEGEDTECCVCHKRDSPRMNRILLCDGEGCGKGKHKQCAGLARLPPSQQRWFCSKECQQHAVAANKATRKAPPPASSKQHKQHSRLRIQVGGTRKIKAGAMPRAREPAPAPQNMAGSAQ